MNKIERDTRHAPAHDDNFIFETLAFVLLFFFWFCWICVSKLKIIVYSNCYKNKIAFTNCIIWSRFLFEMQPFFFSTENHFWTLFFLWIFFFFFLPILRLEWMKLVQMKWMFCQTNFKLSSKNNGWIFFSLFGL